MTDEQQPIYDKLTQMGYEFHGRVGSILELVKWERHPEFSRELDRVWIGMHGDISRVDPADDPRYW